MRRRGQKILRIERVQFIGVGEVVADLELSGRSTVVHGASNTGKSVLVSAIDFMLGADKIKRVDHDRAISRVRLSFRAADGVLYNVERAINGGPFSVEAEPPAKDIPSSLSAKSNAKKSYSRFILDLVGLSDKRLVKNARGEQQAFTLRTLAHLCVIGETKMQSEGPPLYASRSQNETAEASALRLLLTGIDDSGLATPEQTDKGRRLSKAKAEAIGSEISRIRQALADKGEPSELRARLDAIESAIWGRSHELGALEDARALIESQLRAASESRQQVRNRVGELIETLARFELLREQYARDLDRLAMVEEAGSLMGLFEHGPCVFCGAAPSAQELNTHVEGEVTALRESITAEETRTRLLADGLTEVIEIGLVERERLQSNLVAADVSIASLMRELEAARGQAGPIEREVRELVGARVDIAGSLALYGELEALEMAEGRYREESEPDGTVLNVPLAVAMTTDLVTRMRAMATAWSLPNGGSIDFDLSSKDVTIAGSPRASQGKGVRALLHAAFTLALAETCHMRGLPHLGFVVLDSPLVTYKEAVDAESETIALELDEIPPELGEKFYRYLAEEFPLQAIVVENLAPPIDLSPSLSLHFFSGTDSGRAGLYPRLEAAIDEDSTVDMEIGAELLPSDRNADG